MPALRDYIDPGGRMLARRVDQLCSTLEGLGARLRGAIANVIGETIGYIIRDAALHALDEVAQRQTDIDSAQDPFYRPPANAPQRFDPNEPDYWADEDEERYEPYDEPQPAPAPAPKERLPVALSAGLQAAAWWLRRWTGQRRTLTTVAIGLATASVAFLGGPLVVAVLGLAQSATQLTSLSEVIGSRMSG